MDNNFNGQFNNQNLQNNAGVPGNQQIVTNDYNIGQAVNYQSDNMVPQNNQSLNTNFQNINGINNDITKNSQIINNSIESNSENADTITLYDINKPKPVENMPYIFCPRCKGKVIADSRFCSSCGNQVSR